MLGDSIIDAIFGTLTDEKADLDQYKVTEDSIEVPSAKVQEIMDELTKSGGELDLKTQLKKLYGTETEFTETDETILTDEELKNVYAQLDIAPPDIAKPKPQKVVAHVRTSATVYIHTFDGKTTPVILKPGSNIKVMTKDGYVCAMLSMDEQPPVEEVVEAAPTGTRIVEV